MRSYRDLLVWQRAMDLAVLAHRLGRSLPSMRSAALGSQLQRSAASVPVNIAEGAGRQSRADCLRHLSIANGSLLELETHLMLAERTGCLDPNDVDRALAISGEVGRLLAGLMRKLRSSARSEPKRGD